MAADNIATDIAINAASNLAGGADETPEVEVLTDDGRFVITDDGRQVITG